jgi:hypothetical protein
VEKSNLNFNRAVLCTLFQFLFLFLRFAFAPSQVHRHRWSRRQKNTSLARESAMNNSFSSRERFSRVRTLAGIFAELQIKQHEKKEL